MESIVYLSCKPGALVTRFASFRSPTLSYIGATRVGKRLEFHPEQIVAIPLAEFNRHRKEYKRAIRNGELKERTREEYEAWQAKAAEEAKAAAEAAKAAQAAAEEAAKAAEAAGAPEPPAEQPEGGQDTEPKGEAEEATTAPKAPAKSKPKGRRPKATKQGV